jgi:phage protein D
MRRLFAEVRLPTLRMGIAPYYLRVVRESFTHERVVFRFLPEDISASKIQTDTPVLISWGWLPKNREVFVGYVSYVAANVDSVRIPANESVEVVCVGVTRILRDEVSRSWGNTRADLVLQRMTRHFPIESDSDVSPVPHLGLMQHDQSYWKFLVELAHADGMHLSCTGPRIHLWNLDARLRELSDVAPVFDRRQRQIKDFESLVGELLPERESLRSEAFGLEKQDLVARASNPETAQSIYDELRQQRRFTTVEQGVFDSGADLAQHLDAKRRDKGRIYQARVELTPHPPLRPADVIVLVGNGERYNGPWVVDKADFTIEKRELSMEVEVSRANSKDSGRRPLVPYGASPYRRAPSARLAGARWVPGGVL